MIFQNIFKQNIINNYNQLPDNLQIFLNDKNFANHYYYHTKNYKNLISLKNINHKIFYHKPLIEKKIKIVSKFFEFSNEIKNEKFDIIIKKKDFLDLNINLLKASSSILIINYSNILSTKYNIFAQLNKNNINFIFSSIILKNFYNDLFIKFS